MRRSRASNTAQFVAYSRALGSLAPQVAGFCAHVQKTLTAAGKLSASGGQLALTYMAKTKLSVGSRLFLALFGMMTGEPMRSSFTTEDLDALARSSEWTTISNTGIEDWKPELAPNLDLTPRQVGLQWDERIWVGRR